MGISGFDPQELKNVNTKKECEMGVCTDFVGWLDQEGLESAEELLQVYRPVKDEEDGWAYSLQPIEKGPKGRFLLKGGSEDLLLTEKSRGAFVDYMDSLYELGVDGQAVFEHAMAKAD